MEPLPRRRLLIGALGGAAALAALPAAPAAAAAPQGVVLNALEHGVVGDGVADDAPAINALITRLAARDGGVLALPPGTYLVQSPVILRSGVHLTSAAAGHGYIATHRRASTAVLVAGRALHGWVVDSPDGPLVAAGLAGVDVQGNGTAGGIRLRNASWCSVLRSHVNGCRDQGVLVQAGMACRFEDLLITNVLLQRSRSAVHGAFEIAGTDHYVTRCEFTASLTALSSSSKRVVAAAVRGANHFISDSVGETSDVGWWIAADSCRFSNVRADTNLGDGFVVAGASNVFAACSSAGNSQARSGAHDGWVVRGGANAFAACNVVTSSSKKVRYGFRDSVNAKSSAARNDYVGCRVDTAARSQWETEGFLGSSPSVAPHAVRPASGSTRVDVSNAGLVVLFDYSRSATIRHFDGGVNGQTIRVLGRSKVSIASSRTIATATGRTLKTRTRRSYTFTMYDGVWYQSS
jgi:hypothetical protein